jgi:hypothetical protein
MEVQLTIAQKAQVQNERELAHARKIFVVRIVLCLTFALLAAAGIVLGRTDAIWLSVPLAGIALIFLLLALDAWGHSREVSGRRWATVTPRFPDHKAEPPTDRGMAESAANAGSA